jgi:hypothetical protein
MWQEVVPCASSRKGCGHAQPCPAAELVVLAAVCFLVHGVVAVGARHRAAAAAVGARADNREARGQPAGRQHHHGEQQRRWRPHPLCDRRSTHVRRRSCASFTAP